MDIEMKKLGNLNGEDKPMRNIIFRESLDAEISSALCIAWVLHLFFL